eukprot:1232494-Alexandrium_andersonii.AAC.1
MVPRYAKIVRTEETGSPTACIFCTCLGVNPWCSTIRTCMEFGIDTRLSTLTCFDRNTTGREQGVNGNWGENLTPRMARELTSTD